MTKLTIIERLNEQLSEAENKNSELKEQLENIKHQDDWKWRQIRQLSEEENLGLPIPRMEIRYRVDNYNAYADYGLVIRHLMKNIDFIPISSTRVRIQDDVPASISIMKKGILSIMLTMDSKSFPPPHGDGVNHGELGGRGGPTEKNKQIKRQYIEENGQFDALFSFNLRTPPSEKKTISGKKIYTQYLACTEKDYFFEFIKEKLTLM